MRRAMEPELSHHDGTSLPASAPGTFHTLLKAVRFLTLIVISSPDTIDWNSACSIFRSLLISGATNSNLSWN